MSETTDRLKARFDNGTPVDKARFIRALAALLEDDGDDPEEAAWIDQHMSAILIDLDNVARYYERQAQEARDD